MKDSRMTLRPLIVCTRLSLACPDRRLENDLVLPVVIPELELVHVQWQVLGADLMERAHDAALHNGPETFNGEPPQQRIHP